MDLFDHVKNLKPMAEAIVYLAENVEEVSQIEDKLHSLRSDIATAEERLGQIAKAALEHAQMAEQAKSVVIEAQSKTEQMVTGAKAEAARYISDARIEATQTSQAVLNGYKGEYEILQTKIAGAKNSLSAIESVIADKRKDHDAVQASIDSLKARLG